ncbi:MAG TPA: TIGR01777 family oxidoreductase [Chitinophagaceae bacterium]|nr:TIGR01777 family oxidoreductase [Chitinophagaceae bacterium]
MKTVLITGGTGLVGAALTETLTRKGYGVIILTRSNHVATSPGVRFARWDVHRQFIDEASVREADCIVHLAGANVAASRWTKERKKEILESRTRSSALLTKALQEIENKVSVVVSASAIGWYGPDPVIPNPRPFIETDPADASFLGSTCVAWENSIQEIGNNVRLVILRTGIVLSTEGGAYPEFVKPFRFGVKAILGNGRQVISWIHIKDLVNIYVHAIERPELRGVFNAVAPEPVSNNQLMEVISEQKKSTSVSMKVPEFVLKTMLGEMSIEVLKSSTVSAEKITTSGFNFQFGNIQKAVANLEDNGQT